MEYLPGPTSLNSHLLILRPRNDEFVSKYLYYLLHSGVFLRYVDNVKTGTTFFGITQASMGDFRMLIFDKTEQQAIADFLDRKTAQIDTLIAKKQRQIDLLQEQRTALINQAVTKGLNPSAPMKDSGVEWLGKIPSHWEVKPLKHVAILNREVLPEQTPKEYEIRYIDISSVNNIGKIEEPKTMTFSEAPSRARRIIKKNDIIISTVRTYLKTVAIIESEEVNLVASTGFATLTAKKGIEPKFLYGVVSNQNFVETVTANSVGVSYPAITSTEFSTIPIWLPPSREDQQQIADSIEGQTSKIDKLIGHIEKQIKLLQEYRTALISEAVTGKIDVR
jgi:type I restriction enzyme S subunit